MIVGVQPLAGFDKLLHYQVPETLRAALRAGSLVRVPIMNRSHLGLVTEINAVPDVPVAKLKAVSAVLHDFPALTPDLLALARWMHLYYAARMEGVLETMIPAAVRGDAKLKSEKYLSLTAPVAADTLAALRKKAPQQARLVEFLQQQFRPVKKSLVLSRLGATAAVTNALLKRGLIAEETRHVERVAYPDNWTGGEIVTGLPPKLMDEQAAVVKSVSASLTKRKFAVHLLHGVTGSGKTEVYLRAVEQVLAAGGSAIYLVPEVALTPQTVARLRGRFESAGHQTVVWHSHLSEGERLDGWTALATGQAKVVVGARSAVFAPVRDLRLIVVDEEHEPAYKQDETPRYHGRDVAVYRAKLANAVCLLGSATPSLESFANVRAGKYQLDLLLKRVDDKKLPDIHIVDMRIEVMRTRGLVTLSRLLVDHMYQRFERKEQIILFINRRGYSSSMQCRKCGHVEQCPHCSVAMTYHRADDHPRLSRGQRGPAVQPLPFAEMTVPDDRLVPGRLEPAAQPRDGLRRQRHLGHKVDRAAASRQHLLDGAEIHLGLARACDAMQQVHGKFPFLNAPRHRRNYGRLLVVELRWQTRDDLAARPVVGIAHALDVTRLLEYEAPFHQCRGHGRRRAEPGEHE